MPKLIIQIPCFNEAETLPIALAALPRAVPGFDRVEILIIDDGSTDGTATVARAHGVDHVVVQPRNMGLARAFMRGLDAGLAAGADVIVNTDADNQYDASAIPDLVLPIMAGQADMVVGARPISEIREFSALKKALQLLGSWVVRLVSRTDVPDAPSGFRAFSRETALRLTLFDRYSYTLETIIQAGHRGMAVGTVPVGTNPALRPSRLIKSLPRYIWRSAIAILRGLAIYAPWRFAAIASAGALPLAALFGLFGAGQMAGGVLGFIPVMLVAGVLGEIVASNRKLLEEQRYLARRTALQPAEMSHPEAFDADDGEASLGRTAAG